MAVKVNKKEMEENGGGGDYTPETKHIPAGANPAVLVYYAELGKHTPIFKGVPAKYDKGKRKGQAKDPELIIHLAFEFPDCDYDNVPLTIETSVPFGTAGEFINKLPVSDALASNNISVEFANKTAYMKYLNALNAATDTDRDSLIEHLGSRILGGVKNNVGKPDKEGVCRTYANMKPGDITKPEFYNPVTKENVAVDVPDPKGTYGPAFDWDDPTEEAWDALKKNFKKCIRKAVNFEGSPIQALLAGMPDQSDEAEPQEEAMPDNTPPKNTGKAVEPQEDDIPV